MVARIPRLLSSLQTRYSPARLNKYGGHFTTASFFFAMSFALQCDPRNKTTFCRTTGNEDKDKADRGPVDRGPPVLGQFGDPLHGQVHVNNQLHAHATTNGSSRSSRRPAAQANAPAMPSRSRSGHAC